MQTSPNYNKVQERSSIPKNPLKYPQTKIQCTNLKGHKYRLTKPPYSLPLKRRGQVSSLVFQVIWQCCLPSSPTGSPHNHVHNSPSSSPFLGFVPAKDFRPDCSCLSRSMSPNPLNDGLLTSCSFQSCPVQGTS